MRLQLTDPNDTVFHLPTAQRRDQHSRLRAPSRSRAKAVIAASVPGTAWSAVAAKTTAKPVTFSTTKRSWAIAFTSFSADSAEEDTNFT